MPMTGTKVMNCRKRQQLKKIVEMVANMMAVGREVMSRDDDDEVEARFALSSLLLSYPRASI
jgi:hypothetical protein